MNKKNSIDNSLIIKYFDSPLIVSVHLLEGTWVYLSFIKFLNFLLPNTLTQDKDIIQLVLFYADMDFFLSGLIKLLDWTESIYP